MDWALIAAEWRLRTIFPERMPDLATQALEDGWDSPSLRILAGADPDDRANPEMFEKAVEELGWPIPSEKAATHTMIAEVSRRIIDGEVHPAKGAGQLWGLSTAVLDEPMFSELSVFAGLCDDWEEVPASRIEIEAEIVQAARSLNAVLT